MKENQERIKEWYQTRSGRKLTDDEATRCVERLQALGELLLKWDARRPGWDSNSQGVENERDRK